MRVTLGDTTYIVGWQYLDTPDDKLCSKDTICTISKFTSKGPETEVWGVASCSRKDKYIKEEGRKMAFTRALSAKVPDPAGSVEWVPKFNKQDRSAFWNVYFETIAHPLYKPVLIIAIDKLIDALYDTKATTADEVLELMQSVGKVKSI